MIFTMMLILFVGCGLMIPRVNVNTDMTKYLPTDSPMKKGLDKMAEAFPEMDMNTFSVRAMYIGLDSLQQIQLADSLKALTGVAMITNIQQHAPYTLYELLMLPGSDPKQLASEIKTSGREVMVETNIDGNLPDVIVFIIAGVLVFSILFLMCQSWIEPLLFLATIGIAVIINIGSNALLPSVSMTTNAIVAILQLVLSMDYSIILSNRYRQEKTPLRNNNDAMKQALRNATPSVLSSAFTTIVGLLMLCFMKFRIGLDLGIVLAKGVFCSILCLYTVLPALLLMFNNAIEKTNKRIFLPKTDRLARWEYKWRIPLAVATIIICLGSYYLHNLTPISFSTNWPTSISEIFPRKNAVVLLYNNKDEEKIISWADSISIDPLVDTVVAYPTLLMRQQTAEGMAASLEGLIPMMPPEAANMVQQYLTPEMLSIVFQMLNEKHTEEFPTPIDDVNTLEENFERLSVVIDDKQNNEIVENIIIEENPINNDELHETLENDSIQESNIAFQTTTHQPSYFDTINTPMTSAAIANYLGFKAKQAATLYKMAKCTMMSPLEFVHYVTSNILPNKLYASFISKQQKAQLQDLQHLMDKTVSEHFAKQNQIAVQTTEPSFENKDTLIHPEIEYIEQNEDQECHSKPEPLQILEELENLATNPVMPTSNVGSSKRLYPVAQQQYDSITASIVQLLNYITHDLVNDPDLGMLIPDSLREQLGSVQSMMDKGLGQIRGQGYSIAAIVTSYPDEGPAMQAFLKNLRSQCDATFGDDYSLIGESVMFEEMRQGFDHELLVVTLLTIIAIFLIIALTFRSFVLPIMLIVTVLSGVYINVFVSGIGGGGILYLAYLIVQSILMGATIDYAILFTNYYREKRQTMDISHALQEAYKGSIHTITTSGLIIVCAPGVMALLVEDHTISMIVSCLAVGGAAAITLILFVLPGALAALDRFVISKQQKREKPQTNV